MEKSCYRWEKADPLEYDILKANAKQNRSQPTEAESLFWSYAKGAGLGQKCRRQYIIGNYIVDFFFRESMLIIELDGDYHLTDEQQQEDAIRQSWLEKMGYSVLRFKNEEILFETENTIKTIKDILLCKK